jgi:hypothetical protein
LEDRFGLSDYARGPHFLAGPTNLFADQHGPHHRSDKERLTAEFKSGLLKWRDGGQRQEHKDGASVHRHSLLRLAEPQARRDDGMDFTS